MTFPYFRAARETIISLTNWTRISHAVAKLRFSVLLSKGKVWKGKNGKLRNTLRRGVRSPRLLRAEGRVHIFSFSHTYPHTESGRVIRRHPSTARFTVSNLSGKMHRVSHLPAAFPTLPTSRESQDATRAPRQSLTSSAQHTLSRASPFIYARENAKFPSGPRSHCHFGYHLPFAVTDTNLNLAPAANAQSL